jgi:hypothetical protein
MKLPFDQMKFLYDSSYMAMVKALFEENQNQHGWTLEEYQQVNSEQTLAILEGQLQEWIH